MLPLRARLLRGIQAQAFGHAVRFVVQVGGVALLVGVWGLHRFGDWLILSAATNYVVWNDIGFVGAAMNEMIMLVARDQREEALRVFQAVSWFVLGLLGVMAIALPLVALAVPVASWLNLSTIGNGAGRITIAMLGIDALVQVYGGLLSGGFASEGRYGEGGMWSSALYLSEFLALATVVVVVGSLPLAATAMALTRCAGTVAMYKGMRRRSPWLRIGRPRASWSVLKRLLSPALACGAFPTALVVNIQGMVLVLGLVAGPASVAVFSTLRTMSRGVIQLLGTVSAVISPEISRAFAEDNRALLRTLHRRGCRATIWFAAPMVLVMAVFGGPIMHLWTSGRVGTGGLLIYLFLAIAITDALWYTSLSVLYATNHHQRVALYYFVLSIVNLPAAFLLFEVWGLDGVALSILLVDISMLFPVLRQALPAAHDRLLPWLAFVLRPPLTPRSVTVLRAKLSSRS